MSISIGIYDFFSYTIPGVIYLFLFGETYRLSTGTTIPVDFGSLGLMILAVGLSYLLGMVMSPIARLIWQVLFFRKRSIAEVALEKIKMLYPGVEIGFNGEQWPLIFAHIRCEDLQLAESIDKSGAMNIMLRNLSLGLLWTIILQTVMVFQSGDIIFHAIIIILCAIFFVTSASMGLKFSMNFYLRIFEHAISTQLPFSELVKLKTKEVPIDTPKSQKSRANKRG